MTSILKQLCDAPIGLNSKPCAPGPCYAKTVKARHELLETLKADLDKHQNELLESFLSANDEVTDILIMEKFSHGFRECLKTAFCQMCVTLWGRFDYDEGGVALYAD